MRCFQLVLLLYFCSYGAALSAADGTGSAPCGKVSVARLNWATAALIAEIDRIVLAKGFGCDVALMSVDSISAVDAIVTKREPTLIPELWVDKHVREPLYAAVADGHAMLAARVFADGAQEGWWIPQFIADEHPDIITVSDALKHPELFRAEGAARATVHNCPSDWDCNAANRNLFQAFDASRKGFDLIDTQSSAALDGSIARAQEQHQGWLGYYWSPTSVLGRYKMVKLEQGPHDSELWHSCTALKECEEPRVNGWPTHDVFSIVAADFLQSADVALSYVNNRAWSNDTLNELLFWMAENLATGEETAYYFLSHYEALWSVWVPEAVKVNIQNELKKWPASLSEALPNR